MTSLVDIVGHKRPILQLAQDLKTGNLAHAYLFTGPPSIGKITVARGFAIDILLQDVAPEDRGETERRMRKLIHPDLLSLDRLWMEEKMEDAIEIAKTTNISQRSREKAGIKTDVITVDDVREIQDRLQETGDLPCRVCLIRSVERMQDAAANAFLKILEEPPAGRVFILTTQSPGTLLPTIVSRTRVVRFERVADRDVQKLLADQSEEDASFITHVAQGAPGTAMRLMNDPDALREEKTLHANAAAFWSARTLHDRLKQLEPLLERGPEAERFLFHLALSLRQTPGFSRVSERALHELHEALRTNAHRTLQVQKFAFAHEIEH